MAEGGPGQGPRVFVLSADPVQAEAFMRAAGAACGLSTGERTNADRDWPERLDYPAGHIECDPDLVWYLGALDAALGRQAFYVHVALGEGVAEALADPKGAARLDAMLHVFMGVRANGITVAVGQIEAGAAALAARLDAAAADEQVSGSGQSAAPSSGEVDALRADLARASWKLKSYRPKFRYALLPWAVLFFPVTLPAWALISWRRRRAAYRSKEQQRQSKCRAKEQKRLKTLDRDHIRKALHILHADGVDAALAHLRRRPTAVPPGAVALFEAYADPSDAHWLRLTNDWLAHHGPARVTLAGDATIPRFRRIRFAPLEARSAQPEPITVLMPAFNAADTIEASVMSILGQTWRDVELIVIDDASADATGAILDRIAASESRLRVLHNPVNVGPYVSKNAGLACASCDIVTGHDADDLALPNRLECQYAKLTRRPDTRAVVGRMIRMNEAGLFNFATRAGSAFSRDGVLRIASISLMIRRRDALALGYWDCVRFGADSEMINRLAIAYGAGIEVSDLLTMLCLNETGSLTNNAEFGISAATGMSDTRKLYKAQWEAWHRSAAPGTLLHRDFGNSARPHCAPERMLVPQADILTVRAAHGIAATSGRS